jgi:hypothetical protein
MAKAESAVHVIPTLPASLLEKPLAYLAADHDRHRSVCAYLAEAASAEIIDGQSARRISRFLQDELHHHFEDERLSLYPPLCQRSAGDHDFVRTIRRVEEAHAISERAIDIIARQLEQLPGKAATQIPHGLCTMLSDYARREAENLAFENAVIRVIAEVRLKKSDIDKIRVGMKARRGIVDHDEA